MTPIRHADLPTVTGSPSSVILRGMSPDGSIRQIHALMMGGYGRGASQATINAVTRDRMVIAGRPIPERREDLAEQTVKARGDTTGLLGRMLRMAQRILFIVGLGSLVLIEMVRMVARHPRIPPGGRTGL